MILEGLSVSICVEMDIVESWLTLTAFSGFLNIREQFRIMFLVVYHVVYYQTITFLSHSYQSSQIQYLEF